MKVSVVLSLFNCARYLETYLQNVREQTIVNQVELSIVHNAPTNVERQIIEKYRDKLNIISQEVQLEPLYRSWNRAIAQSSGEYLCTWNVDDLRTPDSLERMTKTLDKNPSVGFTYGDIIVVNEFCKRDGRFIKTPEYSFWLGTTGAIGGPFYMWRRSLVERVGYFDEQFKSGADFDYTVRLALASDGKKTDGLIGYFANEKKGLSTGKRDGVELQPLERTVIELRYGIWHKIDINCLHKALDYSANAILQPNGEFIHIKKIAPNIDELVKKRRFLIFMLPFKYTYYRLIDILRDIKNNFSQGSK